MLKKVKDLTVEELINLGKVDNVRNLTITIDGSDDTNKHFDVNIGGVGYGRKLFLDDEITLTEIGKLSYIFIVKLNHQYGLVRFVDKNDTVIQTISVDMLPDVSTNLYSEIVEYNELLPTNNPYRDEVVACIKFKTRTKEELLRIRDK